MINHDGSWAVQPIFDNIACFDTTGIAKAEINGMIGFIYRNGKWAIEPKYSKIIGYQPFVINNNWELKETK